MPINDQINNLLSTTTQLLNTVNVSKQALDNAVNTANVVVQNHTSEENPHSQYIIPPDGQVPLFLREGIEGSNSSILSVNDKGIYGVNSFKIELTPKIIVLSEVFLNPPERFKINLDMDKTDTETYVRIDMSFDNGLTYANIGTFNSSFEAEWITESGDVNPTHVMSWRVLGDSPNNYLTLKV